MAGGDDRAWAVSWRVGSASAEHLPEELLGLVLAYVDPATLLSAVPAVCRRWRRMAAEIPGVQLDIKRAPGMNRAFQLFRGEADAIAALAVLGAKFPKAEAVVLKGCDNLTDAAVVALAERCPLLASVDWGNNRKLTDAAVVALAERRWPFFLFDGFFLLAGESIEPAYQNAGFL